MRWEGLVVLCCCVSMRLNAVETEIALPPKISISSPAQTAVEGRDIPLYIVVDHMAQDAVDEQAFMMDGSKLSVQRISSEKVSADGASGPTEGTDLITSRFKTLLPPRKKGLYRIGPVMISVRGVTYSSGTINLDVQAAEQSDALRIGAFIEAPPQIYPGQEVTFKYRIYFQQPTQLVREDLPFLNMEGFINIGAPTVTTEFSGNENVQTIAQKARATQSGQYEIPSSTIEGMQIQTVRGQQFPIPPLYRAQAPSQRIEILAFPEPRPQNFNGALGSFLWRVIAPKDKAVVNSPVSITYVVSGRGELSTVQFPSLKDLIGLEDFFWVASTSPLGQEEDGVKKFVLEVRPKFSGKMQVPGFSFCSFDPVTGTFVQSSVSPARVTVEGQNRSDINAPPSGAVEGDLWPSFSIKETDATQKIIHVRMLVGILIGTLILGCVEVVAKKLYDRRKKSMQLASRELFYKAIMNRGKSELSLSLLKSAFLMRLYELNLTTQLASSQEELTGVGVVQDVREFLSLIDRQLYQKNRGEISLQEIYDEATSLYNVLKGLTRKP